MDILNLNGTRKALIRNLSSGKYFAVSFPLDLDMAEFYDAIVSDGNEHDYEVVDSDGFMGFIDNYTDIEKINDVARVLNVLETESIDKLHAFVDAGYTDIDEVLDVWDSVEFYPNMTTKEFARWYVYKRNEKTIEELNDSHIWWDIVWNGIKENGFTNTKYGILGF